MVAQDVIRRDLLRARVRAGALNIDLIALNVAFCLGCGYDGILEGILSAARYGRMIRTLIADHRGPSFVQCDAILVKAATEARTRTLIQLSSEVAARPR